MKLVRRRKRKPRLILTPQRDEYGHFLVLWYYPSRKNGPYAFSVLDFSCEEPLPPEPSRRRLRPRAPEKRPKPLPPSTQFSLPFPPAE